MLEIIAYYGRILFFLTTFISFIGFIKFSNKAFLEYIKSPLNKNNIKIEIQSPLKATKSSPNKISFYVDSIFSPKKVYLDNKEIQHNISNYRISFFIFITSLTLLLISITIMKYY